MQEPSIIAAGVSLPCCTAARAGNTDTRPCTAHIHKKQNLRHTDHVIGKANVIGGGDYYAPHRARSYAHSPGGN